MNLAKEYNKTELLEIAQELEIAHDDYVGLTSRKLLKAIKNDIHANGVPANDDCSNLMYNFLIDAEYLNDPDKPVKFDKPVIIDLPVVQEPNDNGGVDELNGYDEPDCYSYADNRDPACKRCPVMISCMAKRENIRELELPCFGKLFDINAEECKECLEAGPCRIVCNGE